MSLRIFSLKEAESLDLSAAISTAFQTVEWLKQTPQAHDILFAVVDDTFIIPFYIASWHSVKVLRIAGGKAGDYQDLIYLKSPSAFDVKSFAAALKEIAKSHPYDIFFAERCLQNFGVSSMRFWESSHQLLLGGSFEDLYEKKIPGKIRNDSGRQLRRLTELGALNFSVADTEADALSYLEKTIELKEEHYRRLQVPSIFSDDAYLTFYQELTKQFFRGPNLRVHASALKLNDQILSVHWGITHQNRFYYMFPAYRNDEFGKYSPGRIHLTELIKWACENNMSIFDFTIGDEGYKAQWCDQETALFVSYHVRNLRGQLFLAKEKLRAYLKRSTKMNSFFLKLLAKVRG